jgi:hypothetical protein
VNPTTLLLLVDLIDLTRLAIVHGAETARRFEAHSNAVRAMIRDGREPTDAERQALAADISALRDRLHSD